MKVRFYGTLFVLCNHMKIMYRYIEVRWYNCYLGDNNKGEGKCLRKIKITKWTCVQVPY